MNVKRVRGRRAALSRRAFRLGFFGAGVGLLLGVSAAAIEARAQTAASPAVVMIGWTAWLQVVVNLMKIVEISVFVFSGYQFWAGRRERKEADAEAAEQARIDSIYQAWQVINSAQGKGGSGGRIEALGDLLQNGISLAGINLDGAWLESVELPRANLMRSSLQNTNLTHANLAGANLEGADLRGAILITANLSGANLRGANVAGARLSAATLDLADLTEVQGWDKLSSISYASIEGLRSVPAGFLDYAYENGAVDRRNPTKLDDDDVSYSQQFRIV